MTGLEWCLAAAVVLLVLVLVWQARGASGYRGEIPWSENMEIQDAWKAVNAAKAAQAGQVGAGRSGFGSCSARAPVPVAQGVSSLRTPEDEARTERAISAMYGFTGPDGAVLDGNGDTAGGINDSEYSNFGEMLPRLGCPAEELAKHQLWAKEIAVYGNTASAIRASEVDLSGSAYRWWGRRAQVVPLYGTLQGMVPEWDSRDFVDDKTCNPVCPSPDSYLNSGPCQGCGGNATFLPQGPDGMPKWFA
jgi:hypothetical protein